MVNLRFLINVRWWWLETLRGRSTYISPRRVDVLFAHTACSYLWWSPGVVVRDRCNVFPQRFPPPCAGGKGLCCIHAHPGCSRGVPGDPEAPDAECCGGVADLLFYYNGMGDYQAQRRGNEPVLFGCATDFLCGLPLSLGGWAL